jgi:hypothetical protein
VAARVSSALRIWAVLLAGSTDALIPRPSLARDVFYLQDTGVAGLQDAAAAAANQFTVSPSFLSFGDQKVASLSAPRTIMIATLAGSTGSFTFAITGADATDFMQANTSEDLSLGFAYAVVAFMPRFPGTKSASLTVTRSGSTVTVALTGNAVLTGTFEIVNSLTGKVLAVAGGSTANGAQIDQNSFRGGLRQQWRFVRTGSGYYRIVNASTGKALDVAGDSTANGTEIEQWNCHAVFLTWTASASRGVIGYNVYRGIAMSGPYRKLNAKLVAATSYVDITAQSGQTYYYVTTAVNGGETESARSDVAKATTPLSASDQEWQLVTVDGAHYKIVSKLSGKVLDVTRGSELNGTPVQQWQYLGNPQQHWALIPVQPYYIANAWSGKVLDVPDGSPDDGALVQQWSANGNKQQLWQFLPASGRYYAILNSLTGKVLDASGASTSNGALIQQWEYLRGANQQWKIVPLTVRNSRGRFVFDALNFKLVNRLSGKVLDDTGFSQSNGTLIQQWTYLGGANQQWRFVPVPN